MIRYDTMFYEVDIQNDFMLKDGKLSVPGAESIIPNILSLHNYATNKFHTICSMDWHFGTEEYKSKESELSKWGGPFPEHCMNGTYGAIRIVGLSDCMKTFFKQTYDIFNEDGFINWVRKSKASNGLSKAIIYGVATDYCVKAAVLGLQKEGIQCIVVSDAIKGVAEDTTKSAIEEMAKAGATFITTSELLANIEEILK